jgi:DNA-binding CsgD family transcriptional regulator
MAALLTRAVELTADEGRRGERLLGAAAAHLSAGAPAIASAMVEEATPLLTDERQRATAQRLRGAVCFAAGRSSETLSILLEAAEMLAPLDRREARDALLDALSAAIFSGAALDGGVGKVAATARRTPLPATEPATSGDLLLDGLATLFSDGHAAGLPGLRRAVAALEEGVPSTGGGMRWLGFGCWAAGTLADNGALRLLAGRLEQLARAQGALPNLTRGLYFLAMAELVAGNLDQAASHFSEGRALMAATGNRAGLGDLLVLAWRGRESETRARAETVAAEAAVRGQGGVAVYADHALAVLDLGLGNYRAAAVHASRVFDDDSLFLSTVAVPDLVEAAVRAGDDELAEEAFRRCDERASATGTDLALGLRARSAALLAPDDRAEDLHREAVTRLEAAGATGHHARAELLYGEWLRRRRRRTDARERLRAAYERFSAIGAGAFAERAGAEVRATGERARRRSVETTGGLTAQEDQVARLAAGGATNAEIATALVVSASTVDYHLRKVFRKLGIASRRELRGKVAAPTTWGA